MFNLSDHKRYSSKISSPDSCAVVFFKETIFQPLRPNASKIPLSNKSTRAAFVHGPTLKVVRFCIAFGFADGDMKNAIMTEMRRHAQRHSLAMQMLIHLPKILDNHFHPDNRNFIREENTWKGTGFYTFYRRLHVGVSGIILA